MRSGDRRGAGLRWAATILVAVLALAGCGGSSDEGAGPVPSTASPAATAAPAGAADVFARVATATEGVKYVRGTLTTDAGGGSLKGTFAYAFTDAGTTAKVSFEQEGQKFNGIVTPDALYVSGGGLPLPGGKKYLKVGFSDSSTLGAQFSGLAKNVLSSADFSGSVKQWQGMSGLRAAGTETINGVTATKYVGTVDPAKVARASAAADAGVSGVDTTVWIGPDGLPVRVKAVSQGVESTTVLDYTDWNVPNEVTVPPASQVTDLDSLLPGA